MKQVQGADIYTEIYMYILYIRFFLFFLKEGSVLSVFHQVQVMHLKPGPSEMSVCVSGSKLYCGLK